MQPPTRKSRTMLLTVLSVGTTTSTTSAAETTAAAKSPPRQPLSTAHDTTAAEGQMPGTVGAPPRITALLSTTRVDGRDGQGELDAHHRGRALPVDPHGHGPDRQDEQHDERHPGMRHPGVALVQGVHGIQQGHGAQDVEPAPEGGDDARVGGPAPP